MKNRTCANIAEVDIYNNAYIILTKKTTPKGG